MSPTDPNQSFSSGMVRPSGPSVGQTTGILGPFEQNHSFSSGMVWSSGPNTGQPPVQANPPVTFELKKYAFLPTILHSTNTLNVYRGSYYDLQYLNLIAIMIGFIRKYKLLIDITINTVEINNEILKEREQILNKASQNLDATKFMWIHYPKFENVQKIKHNFVKINFYSRILIKKYKSWFIGLYNNDIKKGILSTAPNGNIFSLAQFFKGYARINNNKIEDPIHKFLRFLEDTKQHTSLIIDNKMALIVGGFRSNLDVIDSNLIKVLNETVVDVQNPSISMNVKKIKFFSKNNGKGSENWHMFNTTCIKGYDMNICAVNISILFPLLAVNGINDIEEAASIVHPIKDSDRPVTVDYQSTANAGLGIHQHVFVPLKNEDEIKSW
jgi:hypothetical protein